MVEFALLPHPSTPSHSIDAIDVHLQTVGPRALIHYLITGTPPLVPPHSTPIRTDGLWKTTCFELFVALDEGRYVEFNFSPSSAWAAYSFSGYRAGQRDLPMNTPPEIQPVENGVRAVLDAGLPLIPERLFGLSAVIEETDGTKSYWALAHAPGPPDFHNPACFTATLPPPASL
jgi:hypothetical protein